MAMTINTNVVSINAQRNLGLSGGSLSTTMQRLSSGLRVNSAKDDAAGLAIAERMNAQSKGLAIAARNANDGISLAQTTEGALGKIGDMLQRMRELAVQSSNATNSESDRAALQAELSQLTSEIDRVAKTTSFNGTKVLDGSFTGGVFQVGSNAGDNITIQGTTKATGDGLGNVKFGSTKSVEIDASKITGTDQPMEKGTLSIQVGNGAAVELSALKAAASGEERLGQMVAAINEKTADTGVTAFLSKEASGNYTIALKSESAEPVTLKGFESLAGEAGKLDTTAIAADIAAFKSTPVGTAADAKAVVTAFETALPSATGYDAGGNHTVGSVAAKAAAAIVSLKANYNAAGDAWETNKDAG
ncbi:flagellin, partial [Salmonella enterica subsp. enterica serovar Dublin]|nr:flagellin [Salmonella enterica subsp. enterica serovar Dublin]